MPRKVKLSATSHSRNWIASAISPTGNGGGLALSSAISSPTRAVMARQSCTAARTSASTSRDRVHDLGAARLVVDALDVDMDEAFAQRAAGAGPAALEADETAGAVALDGEHRMHDQADVDAALGQLGQHRVRPGTACRR